MGSSQGVADEGGWWPAFDSNEQALDLLVKSIERAGYTPGQDVYISLDIAASELGKGGQYRFGLEGKSYDSDELCEVLLRWIERYPILSIEDPLGEDDERGFRLFMEAVGERMQVVGDDLLVTSASRVDHAHRQGLANCVLLKPNQAGTVSRTKAAMEAARENGFGMIVSARSGESEDITIAHLATGWNAGQIKVGSIARGERTAKWNELLRLEEALGGRAAFAGWQGLRIGAKAQRFLPAE
jgi:enolase